MRLFHYEAFRRLKRLPLLPVAVLVVIMLIGAAMLYSAGDQNLFPWTFKHILRFCVGAVLMALIILVDIRNWNYFAFPLYLGSLGCLIAVEIMGFVGKGGQRWIDLYVFNLQPSEIMKIALVLALARHFHHHPVNMRKSYGAFLGLPLVMILLPALIVMRQPDLGTAVILILCGGSVLFAAGVSWWFFGIGLGSIAAAMPFLWTLLRDYQKDRILIFFNPESDPLHTGYHVMQSKIALGSGGFWGKGFLQGTQSHLNFLPEKQTDFIFTMLCEEFGFIGGLGVIFLYMVLIAYGFMVALRCHHPFGRYLALGLACMLFFHVFINIAMVIGLLPVVGVPLPLMSWGGTAMLTLLIGMGLIFSVAVHADVRLGR